jgi:hypothetical protein
MIIESGIDICQVLVGSVSNDDPHGLWIVAMDDALRLLYVDPVVPRMTGAVVDHLDAVDAFLDSAGEVAYFALAWTGDRPADREPAWLDDLDRRLREAPELARSRLLGLIVFDGDGVHSTLPGCAFSLETGYRDLPRAMPINGPHGLECACPLCAAERRIFDEAYERYGGAEAESYGGQYGERYGEQYGGDYSAQRDGQYGQSPMVFDRPVFDELSRRWYPRPARSGKRWTREEEAIVLQSHEDGLSCFDISLLVKRQPGAIARRLNKLGESSSTILPMLQSPD